MSSMDAARTRRPARPPAIEVEGLARRFGRRWALRGVSLGVESGEAVALLGHNGSGKTTLLRVLSTALRPTRGGGRIYGHDLVHETGPIRAAVGVLGHAPGIYGDLSARENLEFALRMAGRDIDAAALDEALESVRLAADADRRTREFSAGMQRRLGLARLIVLRPPLLLLDEPYASFDADGIDRINAFLLEHRAAGGTVIVSTHDLAKASGIVDRVVRLESGQVVSDDGMDRAVAGTAAAEPRTSTSFGAAVGG